MKLYEVFDRDLRTARLANNGQARITGQTDEKATAELRAELETFVCEGQFAHAVQLILERFLGNLGHPRQDAAWVSGFFGSGKSHLLKMLAHLWGNTEFDDGSTARSLVRGGLPDEIEAHLRELDTQALRTGLPAIAAAGTLLGGTDRVRETVLAIILRSTGWPVQYPQAKFCFWLRERGWLESVRSAVEDAGRGWFTELNNLYVSPHIRRALLDADPNLARDEKGVGEALRSQFPQISSDITTIEFTEAAKEALQVDGALPLTLVVLDEVQQYINEASDRAATITEIAEALQTQFDSRVLLVSAGQSALSAGTPALLWLRDRFKISIELADADVEAVIRKVLLRKKPSAEQAVETLLEKHEGEIARHLHGTRVAQKPEDRAYRVVDYPLLATRRRFWESCFQAVDAAGTQSQLRSQLRILHDALQEVAEDDLGTVLPASSLFNALAPFLVNTGVLLNEINTRIQKLDDGTSEGELRRDLCGLVFLIGKLPREAGVDLGVRSDASSLADLVVDDLRQDSGPFRNEVTKHLDGLADDGTLMKVGEEYRLQTTEGAEWDQAFRESQASLRQNEVEIATLREHLFGGRVQDIVGGIKLTHGESKLRRTLSLHTGSEPPRAGADHISIWLQDGWATKETEVMAEARRLGQDDPTLHVYLPKKSADDLKSRIIDAKAAQRVLDRHGVPTTPEGIEAREGMASRLRIAEEARDAIIREVVRALKVVQGGGSEVFGDRLTDKIVAGANSSLVRLYPQFEKGDHRGWVSAIKRAKDGSDQPFKIVGWEGSTEGHPVAIEVLSSVGKGARGSDVHKVLKAAPFGWPQDAIDAALLALHRSGHLRATKNGQPVVPGGLAQSDIKAAEFRPEKIRLTTTQRIHLRGLFEKAGVTTSSGQEELRASAFLQALAELGSRCGGRPPRPAVPDMAVIQDLGGLAGTEQLAAILEKKEELEVTIAAWKQLAERADDRVASFEMATVFLTYAHGLPVHDDVKPELDAILESRSLLGETDQVTPLMAKLSQALRAELVARRERLEAEVELALTHLTGDPTWKRLDADDQGQILDRLGLAAPPEPAISSHEELKTALDHRSLTAWQAEIDAVPSRVIQAVTAAAEQVQEENPEAVMTTVSVRRGTLADEEAVKTWLKEHEQKLSEAVAKGPVIVS